MLEEHDHPNHALSGTGVELHMDLFSVTMNTPWGTTWVHFRALLESKKTTPDLVPLS